MMIEDFNPAGRINRWSLEGGFPACIEDAVLSAHPNALFFLQRNSAIRSAIGEVEAFERDPAIHASEVTSALAAWRAGDANQEAAVQAAINAAADMPLPDDPRPLPISVSLRQFTQAAAMLELITTDEALAWVKREALPSIMEEMLAAIPAQYRWEARMLLLGALSFEPGNNYVAMLSMVKSIPDEMLGRLWRLAASL